MVKEKWEKKEIEASSVTSWDGKFGIPSTAQETYDQMHLQFANTTKLILTSTDLERLSAFSKASAFSLSPIRASNKLMMG